MAKRLADMISIVNDVESFRLILGPKLKCMFCCGFVCVCVFCFVLFMCMYVYACGKCAELYLLVSVRAPQIPVFFLL